MGFMNLLWFWKRPGHRVFLHTPFTPSCQLRTLGLYAEISKGLENNKPVVEGDKCNIHKPKGVSPKVRLFSKLTLQELGPLHEFILGIFLVLSFV